MTEAEKSLRELWDSKGVTKERQEQLIADITAKAQPGAKLGPFTIKAEHVNLPAPNPNCSDCSGVGTVPACGPEEPQD